MTTELPVELLRRVDISIEARGLMCLLMAYDGQPSAFRIRTDAGLSRDRFDAVMRELARAGLVDVDYRHDKFSRLIGRVYRCRIAGATA